jgi:hypothetical protein
MPRQLFARKPLSLLLSEMDGEHRLRRVLGPVSLTSLGVGCAIGAGIFVLTGKVASTTTGPAIILSFVVAGIACVFAGLCYAEFASMVPVAGSAYTYAYATLGELLAWIIGWDLILEYAVGAASVANGWSAYFQNLIGMFGLKVPGLLARAPVDYNLKTGDLITTHAVVNLPAVLLAAFVTIILVKGIRESLRGGHGHRSRGPVCEPGELAAAAGLAHHRTRGVLRLWAEAQRDAPAGGSGSSCSRYDSMSFLATSWAISNVSARVRPCATRPLSTGLVARYPPSSSFCTSI